MPEASPGRIYANFRGFRAKRAVLTGIGRISPTRPVCNFFAAEAPRLRIAQSWPESPQFSRSFTYAGLS